MSKKISIIGAGLSGPLLATFLARRGYEVNLFERRQDMRVTNVERGRSINLALSTRGIAALEAIGIDKEILSEAIPMYGRMIHSLSGELDFQPYSKQGFAINSVSRTGLNIALMNIAEREPNVKIHFDMTCKKVLLDEKKIMLVNNSTDEHFELDYDVLIGTDGANSALRHALEDKEVYTNVEWLEHGYKELTIPPSKENNFLMEKNALHIWPRHEFMMIALPNPDASFTLTLFAPWVGEDGLKSEFSDAEVMKYFEKYFPDAISMMPTLLQDWKANPASGLATVRCEKWHYQQAFLLGDAAHAVVPFYGQGMNCCFEDCLELDKIIADVLPDDNDEWERVIAYYFNTRKPNADAIAELALQNFVEMRSKVVDEKFLTKKNIDNVLNEWFPNSWLPLYTMVTFSTLPYKEALRKSNEQDELLEKVSYNAVLQAIEQGKESVGRLLNIQ